MVDDDQKRSESPPRESTIPRRKWFRRRRFWLLVLVVATLVFRIPLLQCVGGLVVYNQPVSPDANAVLMLGGANCFQIVADWNSKDGFDVLLIERPLSRNVAHGVIPPTIEIERRILIERGVSSDSIQHISRRTLGGPSHFVSDLNQWMAENRRSRVVVLCPELDSRRFRIALDRVMDANTRNRVFVRALSHPILNSKNWWQSKGGCKSMFGATIRLLYAFANVEESYSGESWSVDELERNLTKASLAD